MSNLKCCLANDNTLSGTIELSKCNFTYLELTNNFTLAPRLRLFQVIIKNAQEVEKYMSTVELILILVFRLKLKIDEEVKCFTVKIQNSDIFQVFSGSDSLFIST